MDFHVMSIQRHRMLVDGQGVTTLIGLDGCPLSCEYCLNKKSLMRHKWTVYTKEALMAEIMQDYCYYVATDGGITFGGGESLLHAEAIKELCQILPADIHVNVETSLQCSENTVSMMIPCISEWIIDVKSLNPEIYQRYTKCRIDKLVDNLGLLTKAGIQDRCKVRVPRIPEYTTDEDIIMTVKELQDMGFDNIEQFDYIIREKCE